MKKVTKPSNIAGTIEDPNIQFEPLTIDGKTYKLCYKFSTLGKARAATGLPVLVGFRNVIMQLDVEPDQFLGLVYAAFLVAQPDITIDEVESMIRPDTFYDIWMALGNCYNLSVPKKKAVEPEPAKDDETK